MIRVEKKKEINSKWVKLRVFVFTVLQNRIIGFIPIADNATLSRGTIRTGG
jgi:hypothetical protein